MPSQQGPRKAPQRSHPERAAQQQRPRQAPQRSHPERAAQPQGPRQQPGTQNTPQATTQVNAVTILGFIGVAILVVLSVFAVRIITGQQPSPFAPPAQAAMSSTETNGKTTKEGQLHVDDHEQLPEWHDEEPTEDAEPEEPDQEEDVDESVPITTAAYNPNRPAQTEPITINVAMIGDVLMHTEVTESGRREDGTYNFDHLFAHIQDDVKDADIRILNQETNLVTEDYGYGMIEDMYGPTFGTPQVLADAEVSHGFNVILKATNHTYDMGYDGLTCEMNYWKKHFPQIPVIGVNNPGASKKDHSQDYVGNVYVYDKDGFRVAILNHTFWTNRPGGNNDEDYMSFMDEDVIREDVKRAKEAHADMIIACPHWGAEFETTPNDEQVQFAQFYANEGVDVILGGHPHILQPCETLQSANGHKTVCYYSAGNFVAANAMYGRLLVGGLDKVRLVKEPDGNCRVDSASLIPLVIHRAEGTEMTTYPLSQYTDELAAVSQSGGLTTSYVSAFVGGLFGDGYDYDTSTYNIDLNQVTKI